jgi:membrane-associated phospholipid phosphatase
MVEAAEPGPGVAGPTVDRRLALRLIIASVLGIGGAIICYFLLRWTYLGHRFDSAAFTGSFPINPAVLWGNELRRINGFSLAVVLVILVVIGFVRRRPLLGVAAAAAAGLTAVITSVLKDEVFTRRFFTRHVPLHANTFPSGHTATAVVCAMALVLVSPPRRRGAVAVLAGAYGWITAIQAQTTSSHRPSDVIGAALLAFAAVAGVAGLLAWFRPLRRAPTRHYAFSQAVLGVIAAAAAATTVWDLAKILGWLRHGALGDHTLKAIQYDAFLTGVALTVVVVVLLLMATLALLGDAELG